MIETGAAQLDQVAAIEDREVEIVNWSEMLVAGISVQAQWRDLWEEVPKAWTILFQRAAELESLGNGPFMDVSLGVTDAVYQQLVGIPFQSTADIPDGLRAARIPAQKLLHHRHRGDVTGITASFGAMYSWAEQQGLKLGEFKLDIGYTPQGEETEHDLYIGLQPEAACRYIPTL